MVKKKKLRGKNKKEGRENKRELLKKMGGKNGVFLEKGRECPI